jgi:hypothetical protein
MRPFFFLGSAVPNVTGTPGQGRYDDRATTTGDSRDVRLDCLLQQPNTRCRHPEQWLRRDRNIGRSSGAHRACTPTQSSAALEFPPPEAPNADYARRKAAKSVKQPPKKPESREAFTARRDHLEPFTCPVFHWIHETAVAHGFIPPAEIPPIAPPVPHHSMNEFLDSVSRRSFQCAIEGQPCCDRSGDLGGKVVIIGYLLDEPDDIRASRGLIEDHLRKGDLVISPAGATNLRNEAVRDQACFGAPQEQCVAIAEDEISARTGEAVRKLVDLALQRLRLIDPDYARQLEETHRVEATEGTARFFDYQNAASRLSSLAPRENRAAVSRLAREISTAMSEADAIGRQETAERGARYAARIRELTDGERTVYVPVAMAIADTLQMEFIADPHVVILARPTSNQRWEEAKASRM